MDASPGDLRMQPQHSFETRRRVEFVDTDMGGIVHFSRYGIFMETTEHLFLESLGLAVDMEVDGVRVSWPRVSVKCEYRSPARFGETLDIALRVLRKGTRSITYGFTFRSGDREVAGGEVVAVCCAIRPGEPIRSVPIPAVIADKIAEAPR